MTESHKNINNILKLNEKLDGLHQTEQVLLVKKQIREIYIQNLNTLIFKPKNKGKHFLKAHFNDQIRQVPSIMETNNN